MHDKFSCMTRWFVLQHTLDQASTNNYHKNTACVSDALQLEKSNSFSNIIRVLSRSSYVKAFFSQTNLYVAFNCIAEKSSMLTLLAYLRMKWAGTIHSGAKFALQMGHTTRKLLSTVPLVLGHIVMNT